MTPDATFLQGQGRSFAGIRHALGEPEAEVVAVDPLRDLDQVAVSGMSSKDRTAHEPRVHGCYSLP